MADLATTEQRIFALIELCSEIIVESDFESGIQSGVHGTRHFILMISDI